MTLRFALVAASLAASGLAQAATIDWNTWTSTTAGAIASTPVSVAFSGETYSGWYASYPSWNPGTTWADGSVVANGPAGDNGIIRLVGGGGDDAIVDTVTFSQAVVNPVFAIWSLGQGGDTASFNFDATPTLVAGGPSAEYGGSSIWVGTGADCNNVYGTEGNGTVEFIGTFTSISWTNPGAENWYGFNVGIAGVAAAVPEPGSVGLLLAGLTLLGLAIRRKPR